MKKNFPSLLSHGIAALIIKDDKYLLLKDSRKAMLGYWGPPHGVCEVIDQCEEDCIVREVSEETTLKIKPIKKLWTTTGDTKVKTVSFWIIEIISGEIKINKEESSDCGWFSLDEAMKLKLYPGTKRFFQLVKEGKIKI